MKKDNETLLLTIGGGGQNIAKYILEKEVSWNIKNILEETQKIELAETENVDKIVVITVLGKEFNSSIAFVPSLIRSIISLFSKSL